MSFLHPLSHTVHILANQAKLAQYQVRLRGTLGHVPVCLAYLSLLVLVPRRYTVQYSLPSATGLLVVQTVFLRVAQTPKEEMEDPRPRRCRKDLLRNLNQCCCFRVNLTKLKLPLLLANPLAFAFMWSNLNTTQCA